ncbi:hypothetical protein [Antarcticimicrobium sediminis]|uniref:Uncharacterized protein n=1 Tax=Antarcticimicrobium sediminis TaxID=2546227 RepID=A0A4V2Z6Q8_9RHOB|nr:hypothetical protein [Antarcticimicrobium sediminis]TDE32926.1 hypothetical protein E1B25_21810 [Antarcticimicrobium sediminis]
METRLPTFQRLDQKVQTFSLLQHHSFNELLGKAGARNRARNEMSNEIYSFGNRYRFDFGQVDLSCTILISGFFRHPYRNKMKWSGKTGPADKMYPTLMMGDTNNQETQLSVKFKGEEDQELIQWINFPTIRSA